MAAGKKRICLILAQVVGRVRGPEGLTIKENLMIRCLMTPWRSVQTHGDFWEDDIDYSETVSYEGVDTKAGAQAKTDEKTCDNCPPEGKVMPMVRRCSRWSAVTISYQTRICGTYYNPETKQIQEFKYCGVSFDGWKDKLCQFWEAKARYDQFFRADGTKRVVARG